MDFCLNNAHYNFKTKDQYFYFSVKTISFVAHMFPVIELMESTAMNCESYVLVCYLILILDYIIK